MSYFNCLKNHDIKIPIYPICFSCKHIETCSANYSFDKGEIYDDGVPVAMNVPKDVLEQYGYHKHILGRESGVFAARCAQYNGM